MFESIANFFKKLVKSEEKQTPSKNTAKERLHLVLMQDRANVSADFLELMKQEIIEVIKKYIEVEESAIDVRLTNDVGEDGTQGAPSLYANIPILNIKNDMKKTVKKEEDKQEEKKEEKPAGEANKNEEKADEKDKVENEEKSDKVEEKNETENESSEENEEVQDEQQKVEDKIEEKSEEIKEEKSIKEEKTDENNEDSTVDKEGK